MYTHLFLSGSLIFCALFPALPAAADPRMDTELSTAMGLAPDLAAGKAAYEKLCAECHGRDGWGSTGGEYPQIAGQHRSVIIKQLADIRAGNRDNPKMFPIVEESQIGGPQAISDIAAYVSTLPMDSFPAAGDGDNLPRAKEIYEQMCARCHGANGEGDPDLHYPLIQGQHYAYLLRQLRWIRDGQRRNANPQMVATIHQLEESELQMLADYVSRLEPPAEKLSDR